VILKACDCGIAGFTAIRARSVGEDGPPPPGTTLRAGRPASPKGAAMAQTRKLYRSRTERMLAGVCGGLAQYFNVDATLMRVLFIVLAVLGGAGLVIYVAMWIIVPKEP
jgi:phage shock protein C